ncbi:MAG: hydroxymethylbilane synthase [Candidatus Omnitrophota bacterium]|nr:hydroxymethylbilane synthase [Candidatus Omnitrophota bacterium]
MIIRIGCRPSRLALEQAQEIKALFPGVEFKLVTYETAGDKDKITPISEIEGSDFFTGELDQALLREEIDLAVHSSKDLPESIPGGLSIAFETASLSPFDALVSRNRLKLKALPAQSRVGTSSQRRKNQLRQSRPDLSIIDIRGTIEERLALLEGGKIDALIVAYAALIRLGKEALAAEVFDTETFPGHPKQGSLSIVAKEEKWQKLKHALSEAEGRVEGSILWAQAPGTGN